MEKINDIPSSPLDLILFPAWVHKKLSFRINGLIASFLFVGAFDMLLHRNFLEIGYFKGNAMELALRLVVFTFLSFLLGIVDVLCTMVPISDFAKMIGKRSERRINQRMPVVLMKSYALSHILFVVPMILYFYSGIRWGEVNAASSQQIRLLFSVILILITVLPYFQLGVIYRTISVRTQITSFWKFVLILATYFWMRICSGAITYVEDMFLRIMASLP